MDATEKPAAFRRGAAEQALALGLAAFGSAALLALAWTPNQSADPHALIKPMLAMFGLTAIVWAAIPVSRLWAVRTRRASPRYYRDYRTDPPAEWIERPARAFNNLMQAPTLFYSISILMIVVSWADAIQLELAWIFVAIRASHALIYIAFNHVPSRFAAFALSSFALWEMWVRFAANAPY